MRPRRLTPLLLLAAACSNPSGPSLDLGDLPASIIVPIGREAQIGTTVIRFHDVLEDSRCPIDAYCIWAGNARVQLAWRSTVGAAPAVMIELNSHQTPRSAIVGDLILTMEGLTPEPRAAGVDARRYRLNLRVERAPVQGLR